MQNSSKWGFCPQAACRRLVWAAFLFHWMAQVQATALTRATLHSSTAFTADSSIVVCSLCLPCCVSVVVKLLGIWVLHAWGEMLFCSKKLSGSSTLMTPVCTPPLSPLSTSSPTPHDSPYAPTAISASEREGSLDKEFERFTLGTSRWKRVSMGPCKIGPSIGLNLSIGVQTPLCCLDIKAHQGRRRSAWGHTY